MASNCDFDASIYAKYYLREEKVPEIDFKGTVITPDELLGQIHHALSGRAELLSRTFVEVSPKNEKHNIQGESMSANKCFKVMQWNILAQGLCGGDDNFVRCPPEALDWSFRRLRLLEEILQVNPDVLCLQEVDHFGFLFPVMEKLGYKGSFFPKPSSPCLYALDNNGPDGCAMFYKISKFASIKRESIVLKTASNNAETNQVCVIYRLALKEQPNCIVTVATTHLKAKSGWENLRKEQGTYLVKYLLETFGDNPLVVCGDFNAEKTEPVYNVFCQSPLNLNSAYTFLNEPEDSEPDYTTWKIRGGKAGKEIDICHTIDFIWYTQNNLDVKSLLSIPTAEEMGSDRLPSYKYPSDHFSLATEFVFR